MPVLIPGLILFRKGFGWACNWMGVIFEGAFKRHKKTFGSELTRKDFRALMNGDIL